MQSLTPFASQHAVKLRIAAIAFIATIALLQLYLWFGDATRILPGKLVSYLKERPASKLPRISSDPRLGREELALKQNTTSDITCGGIDVEGILYVKAAKTIDPDLDIFLSDATNYPQIGLPSSTWMDQSMRERWYSLNTVALWRPETRTYWTANRVPYFVRGQRTYPLVSYTWWEVWNEDITERLESGVFPIYIPQYQDHYTGPEDPRAFEDPYGHVCFVFTMLDMDGLAKIWMFNTTTQIQVALHTPQGREEQVREKNWTPFIHDGKVKFVYSMKPLSIVKCEFSTGDCQFDYATDSNPSISSLHGGTNWVPWYDSGYYISVAHTAAGPNKIYRLTLVVLSTHDETYRITYASGPFDLKNITLLEPFGNHKNISEINPRGTNSGRILIGCSISRTDLFDQDSILISVSTMDNSTTLLEVGGISDLMESIIHKAERDQSWHIDDGKFIECAEKTAEQHMEDMCQADDNARNDDRDEEGETEEEETNPDEPRKPKQEDELLT